MHVPGDLGQVEEGATRLLGLEGLTVVQVVVDDAGGRIVHAVTADGVPAGCPQCGVVSTSPKGRVVTFPRDVPYREDLVRLVWHKHRRRCQERLCPRGSFTESISQVPARARITARRRGEVGAAAADRFSCVLAAAVHYRVAWPAAHRDITLSDPKQTCPLSPRRTHGADRPATHPARRGMRSTETPCRGIPSPGPSPQAPTSTGCRGTSTSPGHPSQSTNDR